MPKSYINDATAGNGRLLATFNEAGAWLRCFWPHLDYGQHIESVHVGMALQRHETVRWFTDMDVTSAGYIEDTTMLAWEYQVDAQRRVRQTDFAVPDMDVMVRHWDVDGLESTQPWWLGLAANLPIYEQTRYQSVRFEADLPAVVHYFRDVCIAIGSDAGIDAFQCGDIQEQWAPAALDGNQTALASDSALACRVEGSAATLYFAFGRDLEQALDLLRRARTLGYEALRTRTEAAARTLLEQAAAWPDEVDPLLRQSGSLDTVAARRLYRRSLLTLHLLQDAGGALIAAPELDEDFSRSGGYAYCWGRDAAFIVQVLEQVGWHKQARRFYEWALRVQEPQGWWEHRHFMDGQLAPSWGVQLDETGSLVWGLARHISAPEADPAFRAAVLPALRRAADYLCGCVDAGTGLPEASVDLWEERTGQHLYTASAVAAGLRECAPALSVWGTEPDDQARSARCLLVADRIAEAILEAFSPERQSFLRSYQVTLTPAAAERAMNDGRHVLTTQDDFGYQRYTLAVDDTIDVSLLGLATPFAVVAVTDPRMIATADAVDRHLKHTVGGIGRYEGDAYIGGNPWVLATLWLALFRLLQGRDDEAMAHFEWVVRHRSGFDLLPEQIDRATGQPAWVVPLAWSHAMYLWFIRELARQVRPVSASATVAGQQ